MAMRLSILSLLALSTPLAWAQGVEFTAPAAGAQIPVGALKVTWQNQGTAPTTAQMSSYQLSLMVGGNDASNMMALTDITTTGQFSTGNAAQGVISAGLAGPTTNGFFLRMIGNIDGGGTVINYSDRFTITGLTGVTPPQYIQAVTELDGNTAGPATDGGGANAAPAAPAAGGGASGIPYGEQTGLTKYAPMQPVPPTKITQKNFTPLNPTSAFTVATTWLPIASILTTLTSSQTFSVSSMENTAAAASQPSGDMAKFLARWKD